MNSQEKNSIREIAQTYRILKQALVEVENRIKQDLEDISNLQPDSNVVEKLKSLDHSIKNLEQKHKEIMEQMLQAEQEEKNLFDLLEQKYSKKITVNELIQILSE